MKYAGDNYRRNRTIGHAPSEPAHAPYIPALRFHWLTPVYATVLRWAFPEQRLKRFVVEQVGAPDAPDLGCGTGTLAHMLQSRRPGARIIGLDIDSIVLAAAHRKAVEAVEAVEAVDAGTGPVQGSATLLAFGDASFDVLVTRLVMHHLTRVNKAAALRECLRVLGPDGILLLADFAAPRTLYARVVSLLVRRLEEVDDTIRGRLPGLMGDAGFTGIQALAHFGSMLGTITVYRVVRP